MADYRYAGTFWPANAGGEHPSIDTILGLPGSGALVFVVADSARYWWSPIKARAALAVWRGLPRSDRLPALLGWDARKVAAECVNLWDEARHGGTEWFTPLNELQFRRESGEDWRGYADMAAKLARLRVALRAEFAGRGQDVRLLFPAWVPGDDIARADEWLAEARLWDGVRLHAYDNADAIRARYVEYRQLLGPNTPLLVDEYNANHTGADERAMVQAAADICAADRACLGWAWYIWETRNDGERDLSIWGNPARLALFRDPPVAAVTPSPPPNPAPEEPMPEIAQPLGVDVASYQGYPDWGAVAGSGVVFGFTKLTEGDGYVNPTAAHNWSGMRSAGLARGCYHFARPDANGAEAEADFFCDTFLGLGDQQPGDILALDLEDGTGDLGPWALAWLRRVEARLGWRPIVYTGRWFIDGHNLSAYSDLGAYGLWLAAYQAEQPEPPAPWALTAFWQYSDAGQVAGIAGNVDLDLFSGPAERIGLYGRPADAPAPAPAPAAPDLATLVGVAYHEAGTVIPALVAARAASDWGQVDAVIGFLRDNNPDRGV